MLGMKIIPSVFVQQTESMEPSEIVGQFNFFIDDLPMPEAFEPELLQWKVRLLSKENVGLKYKTYFYLLVIKLNLL